LTFEKLDNPLTRSSMRTMPKSCRLCTVNQKIRVGVKYIAICFEELMLIHNIVVCNKHKLHSQ
uniref:Uncharacterized protein n=1 Tax=Amphimedon queenslandica TaxID=400682 RepID=A0A1X7SRI6_AMPQE